MIKETIVKYGLYNPKTKKILGYEISSNDGGDFCNSYTVTLCCYENNEWLHPNPKYVEWVRRYKQRWYNSSEDSPVNPYIDEDLKVVKVVTERTIEEVEIVIPNKYELLKEKYKNNPDHWESIKDEIAEDDFYDQYMLSDLNQKL